MTAQEAIKAIQVEGLEITGKLSRFNEFIQGLVVAEEALEKQMPKKPKTEPFYGGRCAICNSIIPNFKVKYCSMCGTKIDWSE